MGQFTSIRKISAKMTLAGIATIIAVSVVAAPGNAASYFSWSGYPGYLAYERTQAQCRSASVAAGQVPEMTTDSPVVAPSPRYGLPQTIERYTRIESSADNGRTWQIWQYLAHQSITLTAPGFNAVFSAQTVDLVPGWSYRVVEGFYYKLGTGYVATVWYRLDRVDYTIMLTDWGHSSDDTPTQYAAGCTVPAA